MARKYACHWLTGVLGLSVALVLLGLSSHDRYQTVDTGAMLAVSVSIKTVSHVRIDEIGDAVWHAGSGSGFLVSSTDCAVWTNHHVIADAAFVEVFPRGWSATRGIPATVVNSTPRADVAILRMARCQGIPEATLADSSTVRPGDETYAVGNPLGHNPDSISRGIISHTTRYVHGTTPYLQTDAAINPGNSGGALFNPKGEVVGINTIIATTGTGGHIGIGYAVPINLVKTVAAQLRHGLPSWGDADLSGLVSSLTPDEAEVFRVPDRHGAIIVTSTPEDGPSAGRLRAHDVIFKINGVGVTEAAQAMRLISSYDAGDTVTFALVRHGAVTAVDVTLAEGWKGGESRVAAYYEGYLGMTLEMWNGHDDERGQFTTPVITQVQNLGPAHQARIASSQTGLRIRGPFMMPYLLDVTTVTGIVLDGAYHPVSDVRTLESHTAAAFKAGRPMLLEIELWRRRNPRDVQAHLERIGAAFYRLMPAMTTAPALAVTAEARVTTPLRP